jgi:hypothetical protein
LPLWRWSQDSEEERQVALLSSAIKEALKKEIFGDLASFKSPEFSEIPAYDGGVARFHRHMD